ncbi:hypothetical protein OYC64_006709 [Pagothenia borchgrevinki]|uniref:MADF domain-containing protein n=1 Tax=Pagothenia borchgrevinki TaxID=8213 RepID=A0ABD2GK60_PAGBO
MEEKLAVGNHPVLYDQSLFTYRDTNRRSQAWREVAETVVGFHLFGEFISSLLVVGRVARKKSPSFRYAHLQDFFNTAVWTYRYRLSSRHSNFTLQDPVPF